MGRRLSFTIRPVNLVNHGASFGPRVATVVFENGPRPLRAPRLEVRLVADIDGGTFQDESGARRRAARAVVPVGRKAANAIASGACGPTVTLVSRDPDWASASWHYQEDVEGFPRWVRADADFRCDDQSEGDLRAPAALVKEVAALAQRMADELHGVIDDPEFGPVFGGR